MKFAKILTVFIFLNACLFGYDSKYGKIPIEKFDIKAKNVRADEKFNCVSVKITQFMPYKGKKFQLKNYEVIIKDAALPLKIDGYGEWVLLLKYTDGKKVLKKERRRLAVVAPHYNVGFLSATVPSLNFCLTLPEITSENSPAIFALERVKTIDYENLVEHAHAFPLAEKEELYGASVDFFKVFTSCFAAYIRTLYFFNPESTFDFYVTDAESRYIYPFFHANGIPEERIRVHLLSDGSASYRYFNEYFNTDDADVKYERLKTSLATIKEKAKKAAQNEKEYRLFLSSFERTSTFAEWTGGFACACVLAKEEKNIEWNLQRARNLRYKGKPLTDKDYISEGNNKIITNFNLGKSLEKWQKAGRLQELKDMLHYSDDALTPVTEKGGKAFVFVGTREFNEGNLPLLIDESKKYFGEEYEYFYKGHPGDVLKEDSEKEKMLTKAGVKILDSAVPMEVYMFFNPKIYIGGYGSSTYFSTHLLEGGEEQFLCLWEKDSVIFNEGGENVAKAKVAFSVSSDGKITVIKDK